MAKNNMNFNATLRLTTDQFKKGVAEVKRSLDGLKRSFLGVAGALGAGLGLNQLLSNLKDTAVQLSVAKNTLENVSKVTKTYTDGVIETNVAISNYKDNLAYVKSISKDYSQDLVAITHNFAQFHAACEKTNLDLEHQQMVFKSLTKAAAYYHMSADRTKDMMNAITQMMSKGKIAAEELRRQLGNALPGAFNLMAAALGVSNAQLDDMMRKGQVIAADALPRFAAMLNTVTEGADFDSLQLSMNRLKNTWYELVERIGAEDMFNGLVNGADKFLKAITKNIDTIKANVKGLVVAILSYKLFTTLQQRGDAFFNKTMTQIRMYEREMERAESKLLGIMRGNPGQDRIRPLASGGVGAGPGASDADTKLVIKFNDQLIKAEQLKKKVGAVRMMSDKDLQTLIAYNNKLKGTATEAKTFTNTMKGGIKAIGLGVKTIGIEVLNIIKGMGIMAVVSAIIGALTSIYYQIKDIRDESKRIADLGKEYEKSMARVDDAQAKNRVEMEGYLKIVQDTGKEEKQRLYALSEINKMLGLIGDNELTLGDLDKIEGKYDKITAAVKRWCEATLIQARIQAQASRMAEGEARMRDIEAEKAEKRAKIDELKMKMKGQVLPNGTILPQGLVTAGQILKLEKEIENLNEEFGKETIIVGRARKEVEGLVDDISKLATQGNGGGGGNKETDIVKVYQKYTKEKAELAHKLREHAITQEEYNKEFDKLNQTYWNNAAATGQLSIDKIIAKMEKGKTLTKMERWYHELMEAAVEAAKRAVLDDAAESMAKELADAIEQAIKDAEKELDERLRKEMANEEADMFGRLSDRPQKQNRDTLFDYKKFKSDILGEEADNARANAQKISAAIEEIKGKYENVADAAEDVKQKLSAWTAEMKLAEAQAGSLEEAMKFQQIQEDIKKLNDDINKAVLGGIKNLAQSTDRVVKGMETLKNTLEDTDASGWEKFMAVFNEIVQIVEMFASISETLNTIEQASQQLAGAELALEQQKVSMLEQELRLRLAIKAAKAAETAETEKEIAADIAEAAASQSASSAKAGEAVAGATAAGAEIPFPYNIIAIAAGVAAVVAALASMSKYAKGGIVGGNSYSGDRQMARVNSGEMILNRAQQGTLWNMLNGKGGVGNNVQFKIRGTDLIGVINNEQSKRRG
jgi:tape measure domain-containing protein